ncbi:MAG: hypothetical protein DRZ90_03190 [Spirochaetes bacterium]|nr:MAG: hypothetical protein DRP60_12185 [Spirochaetota bacterium]RKX75728.1 MAG: hypothetical protein DRP49_04220 [Spirochaetota bacterium]RKX98346.1 MAG: hypothetical protein DRZ90_03190 [Spirochaetota bacterium]
MNKSLATNLIALGRSLDWRKFIPLLKREPWATEDVEVILSKNLYGWFERVRRGVYRLHEAGISALNDVPELKELYIKEYDGKQPSTPGSSASHQ